MDSIVSYTLARERQTLSPFAFLTEKTQGRLHPCEPCGIRTDFQRDRDRIIHSQAFRRLMYKTQVFLAPVGDHYRTRLTHTLEVTQIARTLARALRLNEDLTEAAALGHDLGHTPFGHAGEIAMQRCYDPSFAHYKQSLRVVDKLENDGAGLNLTFEVRDAIVNHTGDCMASTLEGVLVKYADRIAYINHDIDDALRAGLLTQEDIPLALRNELGQTHGERIDTMVRSVIEASFGKPEISMTPGTGQAMGELRDFLFEKIYRNSLAKAEDEKAKALLIRLYEYYLENPDQMPECNRKFIQEDSLPTCVCDFVSGMTDRYAIETYRELFVPEVWRGKR